jgi:alcohol dehydrogenase YqhD (iron-dependent ADH family)
MKPFTFTVPENVHFGMGSIQELPELLKQLQSNSCILHLRRAFI